MRDGPGEVYWLTGLSGAGKSTLSGLLAQHLETTQNITAVRLDGDELRAVLGNRFGYDLDSRREAAFTYSRLCRLLSEQGHCVICSTISLYHDVQRWNRANISDYREVVLRAPNEVLEARSVKRVYDDEANVVGLDIAPEWPENPDLVLHNDGNQEIEEVLRQLCERFDL